MPWRSSRRDDRSRRLSFEPLEARALLAAEAVLQHDAYLDGTVRVEGAELRVEAAPSSRVSYLGFDVQGVADKFIPVATLRLRVTEAGSGTVNVYRGSETFWNERFLSVATAPTQRELVDSVTGAFAVGDWLEFDVHGAIDSAGVANFVLRFQGADGVAFSSSEGANSPQLAVTAIDQAFAGDANADGQVSGADYTIWRDTFGSTTDLRADFDESGTVDAGDHEVWRANFGKSAPLTPTNSATNFGATPNDATFDHGAIQNAINTQLETYLPAGEYWLNAALTLPAGRRLYGPATGEPAVLRVRHDSGSPSGDFAIVITGNNVSVENLVISKDFVDGSYGTGILADNRSNITIKGLEIRNYSVRYGIHLIECTDFEISNCYVHSFLMNQSNPSGNEADMIQDSPAGIRITRSTNGIIRDSVIRDIDVGPNGRASISSLVPSYGPQGHQADGITLSDSSFITVENNDIWNSGELIDVLVSDNCIVRNNTLQMAYLLGIKCIGSQNCIISDNYIADAAVGLILVDHNSGEQATGCLIDRNEFVNIGSRGIWDIAANSRMGGLISGIYIDDNAVGNTISNNNIYNYHNYLFTYIRIGSGANTLTNNDGIAAEFGPTGGGEVAVLGEWATGLTHAKQLYARNRLLMFFTHAERDGGDFAATAVTYGGKALTKQSERLVVDGTRRVYVSAWILRQDGINSATSDTFAVTWNVTPDAVGYSSVFLKNVYQPTPIFQQDTGAASGGNTINTSPRASVDGGLGIYAATAANPGTFTPQNGFTKALEVEIPGADGSVGFKFTTGANEALSITHDLLGSGVGYMANVRRNPGKTSDSAVVDVSTLGALGTDGANDAVIIQNALNNSAYEVVYLPPGVYYFDRAVFMPANKTIRGDSYGVTEIRAIGDVALFRVDGTTGVTIENLTMTRPDANNSNNEIIRSDNATHLKIDSVRIYDAPSRAPVINLQFGRYNSVTRTSVVDYQVYRDEPSPEQPGLHTQVFGSGITLFDEDDITLADNQIIQTTLLSVANPVIKGWHQSSAIQVPNAVRGRVTGNYVYGTGQGIDLSGASRLTVTENFIDECHSAGIKLVNGSNLNSIEHNYLRNCGLTGVWVSVGVQGLGGSYNNFVRYNTMVAIGQGSGLDFWDFNFNLSTPAAIHLQAAKISTDQVRSNTIAHNDTYDNSQQRGVVVAEGASASDPFAAAGNTLIDNVAQTGLAPLPPLF